jgi:hypothetical protein
VSWEEVTVTINACAAPGRGQATRQVTIAKQAPRRDADEYRARALAGGICVAPREARTIFAIGEALRIPESFWAKPQH